MALVKVVSDSQLRSIVQIVYNVLMGMRHLPKKTKDYLSERRKIIRHFVDMAVTLNQRKRLFVKHLGLFLVVIKVIEKEL